MYCSYEIIYLLRVIVPFYLLILRFFLKFVTPLYEVEFNIKQLLQCVTVSN